MNAMEKAKVDALLRLAELSYKDYNDRCLLEWKVHISLWTLLVALGAAGIVHPRPLGPFACIVFAAVPIHVIWHIKMLRSNSARQSRVRAYQREVEALIAFPEPTDRAFLGGAMRSTWWWFAAVILTTLLISSVVYFIANVPYVASTVDTGVRQSTVAQNPNVNRQHI